jgi:hypothetical protein
LLINSEEVKEDFISAYKPCWKPFSAIEKPAIPSDVAVEGLHSFFCFAYPWMKVYQIRLGINFSLSSQ